MSLNSYIKQLNDTGAYYDFDGEFIVALYEELWNDYKHAESSGITSGRFWFNKHGEITLPRIYGDRLDYFKI